MRLLRFSKQGHLHEDVEDVMVVPEFDAIYSIKDYGPKLFWCIALDVDYKSIYRNYDPSDRFKKILKDKFGVMPRGFKDHIEAINKCRNKYDELQRHDLYNDLKIVRKKIAEVNIILDTPIDLNNFDSMNKVLKGKEFYMGQRKAIEEAIEKLEALGDLKLGEQVRLTRLEQKLLMNEQNQ